MVCYLYTMSIYLRSKKKVKLKFECLHKHVSLDKTQRLVEINIIILKNDKRIGLYVLQKIGARDH